MADQSSDFFNDLGRRGHEPLLEQATGTIRFDLTGSNGTEHWLVAIKRGDVDVSRKNSQADCVVRAERSLFDGITGGQVNAMAATLRGLLAAEGNVALLVLFQRLFPGPPAQSKRQPVSAKGGRQ